MQEINPKCLKITKVKEKIKIIQIKETIILNNSINHNKINKMITVIEKYNKVIRIIKIKILKHLFRVILKTIDKVKVKQKIIKDKGQIWEINK